MKHEIDINIRNWTAAKQHSLPPPYQKPIIIFQWQEFDSILHIILRIMNLDE